MTAYPLWNLVVEPTTNTGPAGDWPLPTNDIPGGIATVITASSLNAFNISSITLFDITLIRDDFINAFNYSGILIFIIIFYGFIKFKKHPLFYIAAGAILGLLSTFIRIP